MTLEDIKSEEDVARFIEGCLNDFESGIATKKETELWIHRLVVFMIKLGQKKIADKAFTAGRSKMSFEQFKEEMF